MGYLTGTINARTRLDSTMDLRAGFTRFSPEDLAANWPVVELLKQFGAKKNATPSQGAPAWLLAKRPFIVGRSSSKGGDHPAFGSWRAARVELAAGGAPVG
jgi:aryl-alcohol dehydrogenase-like predicted oxidoreductase